MDNGKRESWEKKKKILIEMLQESYTCTREASENEAFSSQKHPQIFL